MGNAPVAQYGESGGFLNRAMGCVYLLGNPVNSLLLLASGLIQRPSENWGIPHDFRPFPVIVVLRLCWDSSFQNPNFGCSCPSTTAVAKYVIFI